jgi:uncharacterized protein (DUF1810 family)
MASPNRLDDFVASQDRVYDDVKRELAAGRKTSHWMWFIFPQIAGLGFSATSRRFAIESADEARRYLQHPVLGERLRECTRLVLAVTGRTVEEIFGYPDHLKFRSSMTLFSVAAPEETVFQEALEKYFGGEPDHRTIELLG